MATFENFIALGKVAPSGAIGRIIVYGDGSGHIERDNDETVVAFCELSEADKQIARLYTKYNKPIVVGQKVTVRNSSLVCPGQDGITKSFDPIDSTFLVEFEAGFNVYLPTKSLQAAEVVRKVGEKVQLIPQEADEGDFIDGEGLIVQTDSNDKAAPFLIYVYSLDQTFWFSEDEIE